MHFSNILCNRKQSKAQEIKKYSTKECFPFKKVLGKQQVQENYWDLILLLCHKEPRKATTTHSCLPRPWPVLCNATCSNCSLFRQRGLYNILQRNTVPLSIRAFSPVTLTCTVYIQPPLCRVCHRNTGNLRHAVENVNEQGKERQPLTGTNLTVPRNPSSFFSRPRTYRFSPNSNHKRDPLYIKCALRT